MRLVLTGAQAPVGASLRGSLVRDGHEVVPVPDAALASRRAVADLLRSIGGIDGIVHAWFPVEALVAGRLDTMSDAEWDARAEAPIRGAIHLLQGMFDAMKDSGGVVVCVLPTAGLSGQKRFAAAASACEAVRTLFKATARAWGRKGFRAHSIVCAPEVWGGDYGASASADSLLSPVSLRGRTTESLLGDVAAMVEFLLSDGSAGLTGTTTAVDAGRWMPL